MNINKKIEEIRQQPEHVRLRWAWGMTAGFMVVIIFIWIILLKSQTFTLPQNLTSGDPGFSSDFNQQKKSIKDAVGELKSAVDKAPQQETAPVGNNTPATSEGFKAN